MSKKYVIFCLLAIIALASFFRLWQIKSIPPGFYPDEAMNGNNAMEAWDSGNFKVFYPENNGREGLWINIMAPLIAVFGNEPWVPRTVAALIGIFTVLGLYLFTKELFRQNPKSQIPNPKPRRSPLRRTLRGRQIQNLNNQNPKWFGILNFRNWNLFRNSDLEIGNSRGEIIALLASFFLAASFWHINFSRISFRAILTPFFLVWSFYFLWKLMAAKNKNFNSLSLNFSLREKFARPHLELKFLFFAAFAGLLFGLGFHTYISFRVAPLLLIIPFILMWRAGQKKFIFVFLLFAFIIALPLGIYFLKNPQDFFGRASQVSIFSSQAPLHDLGLNIIKTFGMFFVRGDYNWRHNFSGAPELWWPTGFLFLLGIFIGIKNLIQNSKFKIQNSFLFSWLIIMLIPTIISNEGIPHALRSLSVVPAVMIFAALGLEEIIKKVSDWLRKKSEQFPENIKQISRIKKELVVLLLMFFLAAASQSFNQYFFRWAQNPNVADAFNENYVEIGKYLNTLAKEIPKYVIVNAEGVDVRGIPMPSQTVMYITKTFLPLGQKEKNIFYILPKNLNSFIQGVNRKDHFYITMLENDFQLYLLLKDEIPNLKMDTSQGLRMLYR
jgi:4-amino-4-deoxy-L-arabinose transferase-like glycosyltransferase